jgi:hypothetical protein
LFGAQRAPFFQCGPIYFRIDRDAGVNMMRITRRRWIAALVVTVAAAATMARVAATRADIELEDEPILAFSTMRGSVPGVDINDNVSPTPPWVIADADGILSIDGDINILVRGLVFAPSVPNVGGTNPVRTFRAIVSCTTVVNGVQEIVNITTGAFPADAKGNCIIHDRVTLPNPCFAPIVFVGPAPQGVVRNTEIDGGTWFAVTGN